MTVRRPQEGSERHRPVIWRVLLVTDTKFRTLSAPELLLINYSERAEHQDRVRIDDRRDRDTTSLITRVLTRSLCRHWQFPVDLILRRATSFPNSIMDAQNRSPIG